jgi:hypothetical protein
MSHPIPSADPENMRTEDSKFAPRAKSKALKNKMKIPKASTTVLSWAKKLKDEVEKPTYTNPKYK